MTPDDLDRLVSLFDELFDGDNTCVVATTDPQLLGDISRLVRAGAVELEQAETYDHPYRRQELWLSKRTRSLPDPV